MIVTGSAISVLLLGVAYYANIHHIGYFIAVQVFGGIMQVHTYTPYIYTYTSTPVQLDFFVFELL